VPELYGRWEAMIDSSGVKDDDDLEDAGQAELSDRNRIKGEYTRTLTLAGSWLPFRDYNVGDWITAPGADGDEKLRVMQITITRDEQNGLGGNIVLGDRFTNKDLALAGRVSAITGGTTGVIGNGTVGSTLPQDTRVPSAPTGLSVTGELYMNAFGEWRVRGRFSWAATSTATDGTDLDIAKYEILGQQQTTPTSVWRTIAATSANATTITKEEFLVASQWVFTVRAYGVSTTEPGTQSSTTSITFGTDTVAPNTPATPTATSYLGTGVVGWSGLDSGGGAMPLDFVRCEVHLSTTTGFTPSSATRKAAFLGGGTVTLSGLTYGTPYFVKLVAYDQSGNASTPSAQATFTPQQAVTADITQNAIDNTLLAPGAITNDKIAARSILASSMVLTDFANHVENPGFETGDLTGWTAPAGGWTTQVTAASHSGAYRAVCAAAGASRPLLSGTVVDVVPGDVWVVSAWAWTDLDGAGVAQIGMLFDTGTSVYPVSVPAVSSGWQRYTAAYTIPSGVKQAQFRIFFSATTGTLRLDDTYLRRANNAELIVDGSLTAIKMSSTDIFTINLYSGLPTGTHVRVTPNGGFSAWSANPAASGAIQSWARMGDSTSGDGLSIGFDAANPDAAIRSGGFASFQSVITEALRVKGDTLDTYLSRLPQGRNSYAESGSPTTGISTTETGIVELRAILQPGRTYSIAVENISVQSSAGAIQWRSNIRYALDGAAVSTASTGLRLNVTNYIHPSGVYLAQPDVNATMRTGAWGAAREVRLLFSAWLFTGSGTINTWGSSTQPLTLTVRDEGPDMAATTTQIAHVTVWNSSALYLGGAGSAQTSLYVNDTQIYAHALFNSNGVLGEAATVAAALSGATLLKAEAGVYVNNMWAYSTLGNNLPIRVAANTNTTAQSGLTSAGTSVASPNYAAPEFKWIDISSIFSTSSRSITLWDHIGNGSGNVYQVLNNATHPVQLRLTYLR